MPEEPDSTPAKGPSRNGGPDPGRPAQRPASETGSLLNWKLVVWGVLISGAALAASETTGLWWLVLVFGLLVPAISALRTFRPADREVRSVDRPQDRERELLGALGEVGELTPTTAAMRTTLTVEEAAGMLEKLAERGHLEARTQGAVVIYGLWEPDRLTRDGGGSALTEPSVAPEKSREEAGSSVPPLVEPLTEREAEVLGLLASGRTNREIAADLFVTVGTIKAHTSNIYAKLQARNRAEALARARELGLLD